MAPSGGRLGAEAPSSQSRRFRRKPLCPYYNDVLDAVQPRVEAKFHAQSLLQFATCTFPGYIAIHNDQTEYIDYTGEEHDYPTSGLTVNLNIKTSTKLFIAMDLFAKRLIGPSPARECDVMI